MRVYSAIIISLVIIFQWVVVSAQQETLHFDNTVVHSDTVASIEVIAQYSGQSMWVRWGINLPEVWYEQCHKGYLIEWYEVDSTTQLADVNTRDTALVKAWTLSEFRRNSSGAGKEFLTVAESIYGGYDSPDNPAQSFGSRREELINKYSLALLMSDLDQKAAMAGGLFWEHHDAVPGKTYLYRVSALNPSQQVNHGYVVVHAEKHEPPAPVFAEVIEQEDRIVFQWEKDLHESHYSAYYLEVSSDNIDFKTISELPFVGGETSDYPSALLSFSHQVANYQPAYYRLVGISPFGVRSSPGSAIRAMGRDRTPPDEVRDVIIESNTEHSTVHITWQSVTAGDIGGYLVYQGYEPNGEFRKITDKNLAPAIRTFTHKVSDQRLKWYYKIGAIDTAGNESLSNPFVAVFRDTLAPDAPGGLHGVIDSNGVVRLSWHANKERDLAGYFIYRSNSKHHIFTNLLQSPVVNNTFIDTISMKTLTEHIYYRVTAVDYHGHVSPFSTFIELKRPDMIPPMPPGIVDYIVENNSVTIYWTPGRSRDIVRHEVYVSHNNGTSKLIRAYKEDFQPIVDTGLVYGDTYEYLLLAVDDSGNKSKPQAKVVISPVDKRQIIAPQITQCQRKDSQIIELSWSSQYREVQQYIIYRSVNNDPMMVHDRVGNKTDWSEKIYNPNDRYTYAVKLIHTSGRKSPLSESKMPE